jgi:hypothetical protein
LSFLGGSFLGGSFFGGSFLGGVLDGSSSFFSPSTKALFKAFIDLIKASFLSIIF